MPDLPVVRLTEATAKIVVPKQGGRYVIEQTDQDCDYQFRLESPKCSIQILGIVQTEQNPSLKLEIIHAAPQTRAETLIKTLASQQASPRFEGKIRIEPNASNCESYLNHHSLVFDQAKSYTWPALEINNNEVKCSHAATIKTITNLDLFYLQSRGLSKPSARELLIQAFLNN